VLSCAVGNHVDLRGLPGGAEGIRTWVRYNAVGNRFIGPAFGRDDADSMNEDKSTIDLGY
jgi:hypothetical protein